MSAWNFLSIFSLVSKSSLKMRANWCSILSKFSLLLFVAFSESGFLACRSTFRTLFIHTDICVCISELVLLVLFYYDHLTKNAHLKNLLSIINVGDTVKKLDEPKRGGEISYNRITHYCLCMFYFLYTTLKPKSKYFFFRLRLAMFSVFVCEKHARRK